MAAASCHHGQQALCHFAAAQLPLDGGLPAAEQRQGQTAASVEQQLAARLRARVDALEAELAATRADGQRQQRGPSDVTPTAGLAKAAAKVELGRLAAALSVRDREAAVMKVRC